MNSSNKRIEEELNKFDYNKNPLRLTFGVVIVIFLCSFLIVIATFTELSFSSNKLPTEALLHPWAYLTQVDGAVGQFVWGSNHIPQIPVIIFIAALLGSRFGFISVMLYIIAGLTAFPVFALGGGLDYVFQYNFGYILAYLPAVVIAGNILGRKLSFKNALKAVFFGVLLIHFIGIMYTAIVIICKHDSYQLFMDMVAIQSGVRVIYDCIFSLIAVLIARPVKRFLWLAMG
ncbi:biotin transporter BioY [bacterium]|nr:biotin transporter BioY [bacterium]